MHKALTIRPIETGDHDLATRLLAEGFPARTADTWPELFDRMQRLGANAATGVPFGYLLMDGRRPAGVMLTPASPRTTPDGQDSLIVNLSSWYIEPALRWRAVQMLRAVLRRHEAMFTDLTATPEVRSMMLAFGFVPLNDGVVVSLLPVAAALPSPQASVAELAPGNGTQLAPGTRRLLESHQGIGCIAAVLQTGDGATPLLFRPRRLKGLPAAKLVYCESTAEVQAQLPAVARFLLRRGIPILVHDHQGLPSRAGQLVRRRGLKFARPGAGLRPRPGSIDHAGSELSLMDFF